MITGSSIDRPIALWPSTIRSLIQLELKNVSVRGGAFDDLVPRDCDLKHLHLVNVELPKNWMRLINHTKHLQSLDLTCTTLDDDMLRECLSCRGLKYLNELNATATNITDDGVSLLATRAPLEEVQLAWTNTTPTAILAAMSHSQRTNWCL